MKYEIRVTTCDQTPCDDVAAQRAAARSALAALGRRSARLALWPYGRRLRHVEAVLRAMDRQGGREVLPASRQPVSRQGHACLRRRPIVGACDQAEEFPDILGSRNKLEFAGAI